MTRPDAGSNPEAVVLGAAIRQLRAEHDAMSQDELIRAAEIGRSPLQDVETGRRVPRAKALRSIAAAFGMDVAELRAYAADLAAKKPRPGRRTG